MINQTNNKEVMPAKEVVEIVLRSIKAQIKCKSREECLKIAHAAINKVTPKFGVIDNFDELIKKYE
jgi:hypothetical protein